jgi:hypothetical protein
MRTATSFLTLSVLTAAFVIGTMPDSQAQDLRHAISNAGYEENGITPSFEESQKCARQFEATRNYTPECAARSAADAKAFHDSHAQEDQQEAARQTQLRAHAQDQLRQQQQAAQDANWMWQQQQGRESKTARQAVDEQRSQPSQDRYDTPALEGVPPALGRRGGNEYRMNNRIAAAEGHKGLEVVTCNFDKYGYDHSENCPLWMAMWIDSDVDR